MRALQTGADCNGSAEFGKGVYAIPPPVAEVVAGVRPLEGLTVSAGLQ